MKTVLIVDDNPDNRELCVEILEDNYDLLQAADGLAALRVARDQQPDLILLDMSLPKKSGWEVARELRDDPKCSHIRIMAVTAHAMSGDREKALRAGCDAYMSKPVSPGDLLREVERILGPPGTRD